MTLFVTGHVVGERDGGILHDDNVVAFLLQCVVDAFSHPEPSTKPRGISTMFLTLRGACLRCRSHAPPNTSANEGQ